MRQLTIVITAIVLFFSACSEMDPILPAKKPAIAQAKKQPEEQNPASSVTIPLPVSIPNAINVSTTGDDSGDGTAAKPFRTLAAAVAKAPVGQGYTLVISAGTFVLPGLVNIPPGVNVLGAGIDKTILKSAGGFYYHPPSPDYAADRFLISMNDGSPTDGNQYLRGFTIDGDSKQLHGGIYVHHRNRVTIEEVSVRNTNFTGIWLWDVKNSTIKNTKLTNCSWGSAAYCSGALNLGNIENVDVDRLTVDESTGYGIKAIGPSGNNNIIALKIHDSNISVNPTGLWDKGSAPNIAIELWSVNLVKSEIFNNYIDNTISLINSNATPSTGVQTIRVYNNIIDMDARAKGAGYAIELTIHDAEIDHNFINKGTYGIANWDHPMKNWSIHHNIFYGLQGQYPGEILRSQATGLHNVKFYNNTIEFAGNKTMNVVGVYGGSSENVDITNNLIINNNNGYSFYPNQFIHIENGASMTSLKVRNNSLSQLSVPALAGVYQSNLLVADPKISKNGNRSASYYMPISGSPLINAGINVGFSYKGTAPDIGALEYQ